MLKHDEDSGGNKKNWQVAKVSGHCFDAAAKKKAQVITSTTHL
jgi:hypothetical protein